MNKLIKLRKNAGYTLLELVVVFTVAATLAVIGIGAYSTYNKTQQLTQSALNAQQLINQARGNSLSVVKTIKLASGTVKTCSGRLNGYNVRKDSSANNKLNLYIECDGEVPPETFVKSVVFQGEVVLDTAATTCTEIKYESLRARILSLPSPCNYIIKDLSGRSKTLRIDTGGNTTIL